VSLRILLARTVVAALIFFTALVSVGLTAPADSPFSIGVRPIFLRLDPESIAASRAHAFGLELDVTFGSLHLHYQWRAIPLISSTTKSAAVLL
jgi:hypothetical protein